MWFSLEHGQHTSHCILNKNLISLYWQVSTASSSLVSGESSCLLHSVCNFVYMSLHRPSPCCLHCCNSYIQLTCFVEKILFLYSQPPPLVFTIFPTHLPRKSLRLTRMSYDINVSFKAEHAVMSYSLHSEYLSKM